MTEGGRLLVVGSSIAGVRAVEGARSAGWAGPITLLGSEVHPPYDRPPLSKELLAPGGPTGVPQLRSAESLAALEVEIRSGVTATSLDAERRVIATTEGEIGYDALVIATGGKARRLPGAADLSGVRTIRDYGDAVALRHALDDAGRVVVIGAGFIGSEVASAARERGLAVSLVEAAAQPLARAVGPVAAGMLAQLHEVGGSRLVLGTPVRRVVHDGGEVTGVELGTGEVLPADVVVPGIGALPCAGWLSGSGIAVDPDTGGVLVDDALATGLPGVWAAGDVACAGGHVCQHWTTAAEQGRIAGANAAGAAERFGAVPFGWSQWYGHRIQTVGTTTGATEEVVDEGLVLSRDGEEIVGAVAIDRPRELARVRRALLARARSDVASQTTNAS